MTTRLVTCACLLGLGLLAACGDRPAPLLPREHAGFDDAVATLDLRAARTLAQTPAERLLCDGLEAVLEGRRDDAREALCQAATEAESEAVRERAVGLSVALFRQGEFGGERSPEELRKCITLALMEDVLAAGDAGGGGGGLLTSFVELMMIDDVLSLGEDVVHRP